jgi:hypothetical protein
VVKARATSEVRDDRWVHLSAGREERAKAARLEALPREEGGNRVRHHRRAGRLGRPRGRGPVGRGVRPVKKNQVGHDWAGSPLGRLGRK